MSIQAQPRKQSRFWEVVQPQIVRLYKIAGLVALSAILIGLVGFLVVNIFYFFDHTWVRPMILTPETKQVVEARQTLNDARAVQARLDTEQIEIDASLAEIDRSVASDDKFIVEVGTAVDAPKTPEQWLLKRQVDYAKLDKANQEGRRAPLKARLGSLASRRDEQAGLVKKLQASPFLRALDNKIVLAFVPYQNMKNVALGTKLYSCSWGLVMCSKVGVVKSVVDGEVQGTHPHDESIQRGQYVEVELSKPSAEGDNVLFAGGKPLWLF